MDRPPLIRKTAADLRVAPNLADYTGERRRFTWAAARAELAGLPGGGLNIAWEAVDRHAAGALRDKTAFRFLAANAAARDISYAELSRLTDRFAHVLKTLGVQKGERLFILAGRIPELYVALLGGLKNGTVVSPLFSAFGPEPIATRVNLGEGCVLVTTDELYRRKVEAWRGKMPTLRHVLLVAEDGGGTDIPGTLDFARLMAEADEDFDIARTAEEDMALLHFTSGTTGMPKGAIHVHGAVTTHYATGRYALDLHQDDLYWCTADPGWVTGTSYGIVAPLLHGVTSIVDREEFDVERWYGMNLAALWKLPVLFCCENNRYAMGTAIDRYESQTDLCAKATSYKLPALRVDGMDVVAVHEATQQAQARVRAGEGPLFIEYQTYRFRAHSMFDAELYRSKAEVEEWKTRGPIHTYTARLKQQEKLSEEEFLALDAKVNAEVDAAVAFAEAGSWEPVAEMLKDVYTPEHIP